MREMEFIARSMSLLKFHSVVTNKIFVYFTFAVAVMLCSVVYADQLEEEHELSHDFVTPHTKWAKPYARGKIRGLFFSRSRKNHQDERDIIEILQRFDIEADAAYYQPKENEQRR